MQSNTRARRPQLLAALAMSATAVVALAACDSGGSSTDAGTDGTNSATAGSALPKASDMASIASYLNQFGSCLNLTPGQEYDASDENEKNPAWGEDEAADSTWGIGGRAVCTDRYSDAIALLSVPDMRTFQTAAKKDGHAGFLVGKDFAVVPVDARTVQDLSASGLRYLTCDRDFTAPSGYEKQPALVDGCVLSTYVPA